MNSDILNMLRRTGGFFPGVSVLPREVVAGDVVANIFWPDTVIGVVVEIPEFDDACVVLKIDGKLVMRYKKDYLKPLGE